MEPVTTVAKDLQETNTRSLKSWLDKLRFGEAAERLQPVVIRTPLQWNANLSRRYQCNVYLKREDLQVVRSYKLRGAFNMISSGAITKRCSMRKRRQPRTGICI